MLTATGTTTLRRLSDPAEQILWTALDARYRPLLLHFGLSMRLNREEAADAAQEALIKFAQSLRTGAYCRERGRLRPWLFAIARRCAVDQLRARGRNRDGDAAEETAESPELLQRDLNRWRRSVLIRALEEVRAEGSFAATTLQAFQLYALGGLSADQTAQQCGLSIGEVYVAKSRVVKRLRRWVEAFTSGDDLDESLSSC